MDSSSSSSLEVSLSKNSVADSSTLLHSSSSSTSDSVVLEDGIVFEEKDEAEDEPHPREKYHFL